MILKNPKHEHFCQLVANGSSNTESAKTAGFSERRAMATGSELAVRPEVIGRIAELRARVIERVTEKTGIDKAWVLAELVEVVQMAKAAESVMDAEGNPIGEYKQNLAAANKALELIGKEFAMFVDRKEVRTGPLDGLEHEQLKELNDAIESIKSARSLNASGSNGLKH